MAKSEPVSEDLINTVVAVIDALAKEGSAVANDSLETAKYAIRRWRSSSRRGVDQSDLDWRIRDLTNGLGKEFDALNFGSRGHGLHSEFVELAERIADALCGDNNATA